MDGLGFFFPSLPFGLSIIDFLVILIIAFYAWEGYRLGFVAAALDLLSFILSFLLALKLYDSVGGLLVRFLDIPLGFSNAIGFFIVAFIAEILLSIFLRKGIARIPAPFSNEKGMQLFRQGDHYLGVIPGIISSLIILSFAFSLIVSLPSSPIIKQEIATSHLGGKLVAITANFEKSLNKVFGGAIHDTLTFMTIEPQSNESLNLHFTVPNPQVASAEEEEMLRLLNIERSKRGLPPLVLDLELRDLARAYSADMFRRGYFSHYTPEGFSPFDRMERAGIEFVAAGENLALAPSTQIAMDGLMNSPGHRANMLSSQFGHVGIGAMQGGIYGIMFSQEFTE